VGRGERRHPVTGWTFRAWWPLEAVRNPAEYAEACHVAADELGGLAAEQGARIVGVVAWRLADGHLIAEAPAEPVPPQEVAA